MKSIQVIFILLLLLTLSLVSTITYNDTTTLAIVKVNRLGTIKENGSGAVPDDFAKNMGTHGFMRMTTADFDE